MRARAPGAGLLLLTAALCRLKEELRVDGTGAAVETVLGLWTRWQVYKGQSLGPMSSFP